MKNWEMIQEAMDQIVLSAVEIKSEDFLTEAKAIYEQGIEGRAEGLFFTGYLTLDHRVKGVTLFEKFLEAHPETVLSTISQMSFSVFEVMNYPAGMGLKDLYTKADYLLTSDEEPAEGDLIVGRLITAANQNYLAEDAMIFPASYKEAFRKGIMEKYNEYVTSHGLTSLEDFLRTETLVLMKFVEILNEVEQESMDAVEDYTVYQTVFLVGDPVAFKNMLTSAPDFEISLEESSYLVAKLYTDKGTEDEDLVAELVLDGNRIEIESLDEFRQNMAKEKMISTFGNTIAHFKDEVLSMDDLL